MVKATASKTLSELHDPADDAAVQLLRLAARLHAARGDAAAWQAALQACGEWFGCADALDLAAHGGLPGPDELDALAGRVTHCAGYRIGGCGDADDALRRARCAAFAHHLHEAAQAHRHALRAVLFDQLPATWLLDRDGRVQDANAPARALTVTADRLALADGRLVPAITGGEKKLRKTLADLAGETRFAWSGPEDAETLLLLRPLHGGRTVAATLLADRMSLAELARSVAQALSLSPRQSELAAHLLAGQALAKAAREMGISRHTANEHLAALLRRTGAGDREDLVALLLAAMRR